MANKPRRIKKEEPEGWTEPKRILVALAHPDDPEFFCGATLARWAHRGHEIHYLLLTRGDKGSQDRSITPETLMEIRVREERAAAEVLGVCTVQFLNYPDGYLFPSIEVRKAVTRVIRQVRPEIIVTSDPTNYYPRESYLNHPDHRLAGEIVLAAAFPSAGNPLFFPELIDQEGLDPAPIKEIWISLTHQPNVIIDVTRFWDMKIRALYEHHSQIGEPEALRERMLSRRTADSTPEHPRFEETFRRLVFP